MLVDTYPQEWSNGRKLLMFMQLLANAPVSLYAPRRFQAWLIDWTASVLACKPLLKEQPGRLRSSLYATCDAIAITPRLLSPLDAPRRVRPTHRPSAELRS